MNISPDTPGYIAPGTVTPYAPAYDRRPKPKKAKGQIKGFPAIKIFTDCRTGKTTTLVDR